jgi:hypothetical protein
LKTKGKEMKDRARFLQDLALAMTAGLSVTVLGTLTIEMLKTRGVWPGQKKIVDVGSDPIYLVGRDL